MRSKKKKSEEEAIEKTIISKSLYENQAGLTHATREDLFSHSAQYIPPAKIKKNWAETLSAGMLRELSVHWWSREDEHCATAYDTQVPPSPACCPLPPSLLPLTYPPLHSSPLPPANPSLAQLFYLKSTVVHCVPTFQLLLGNRLSDQWSCCTVSIPIKTEDNEHCLASMTGEEGDRKNKLIKMYP